MPVFYLHFIKQKKKTERSRLNLSSPVLMFQFIEAQMEYHKRSVMALDNILPTLKSLLGKLALSLQITVLAYNCLGSNI